MHPTIYAQRNAIAEGKLTHQASEIARIHNAEGALEEYQQEVSASSSYSPEVSSLLEKEARVKLNEAILSGTAASNPSGDFEAQKSEGLHDIEGVGPETVQRLNEAGYYSKDDIRNASNGALNKVEGVGASTITKLRKATEEG